MSNCKENVSLLSLLGSQHLYFFFVARWGKKKKQSDSSTTPFLILRGVDEKDTGSVRWYSSQL